ncbi:MAG: hypothetical protein O2983_09030 [Planctomycetota bacterium]|nr:hypothetical protein [Planctomycetota bacterium]MDA0919740.1 hypothetical protein [Planctomycetota bacterium]MDA1159739.1 hypothetical protein [Planctomycetota bacterium]
MVNRGLGYSAIETFETNIFSPLESVVISCGMSGIKDEKSDDEPLVGLRPRWDSGTRELWLGDWLLKRLIKSSENQQIVLDVFEEMGWPVQIEDPIPPKPFFVHAERVRETCRRLNKAQIHPLMHFRASPSREVILWEIRDRLNNSASPTRKPR